MIAACAKKWLAMKHKITNEQAEDAFGIELTHERMENDELRFRLFGDDLNGYIRTVATSKGGWQKSHVHTEFKEFYLVDGYGYFSGQRQSNPKTL